MRNSFNFKNEYDMVKPVIDHAFAVKVSMPILVFLKDGRPLENCRYYPDTQVWSYMGMQIVDDAIDKWCYMSEIER